jgi:tetratricopeptide (TPR) repeat protein
MGQTVPKFISLLSVVLMAGSLQAQPPTPDSHDDEARGLFLAGRAAFDGGRYEEAMGHFERAYELSRRPGLLYNIGHTAQLMGTRDRAIEAFEQYLALNPEGDRRDTVEARLSVLRREPDPAPDGQTDVVEPPHVPPEQAPDPVEAPSRAGPIALVAGGAALAIGGAVSLGLAASSANTVTNAPQDTPWSDVEGDHDAAVRRRGIGIALASVGVALAVAGSIWWSKVGSHTEVAVGPAGVHVRGSF